MVFFRKLNVSSNMMDSENGKAYCTGSLEKKRRTSEPLDSRNGTIPKNAKIPKSKSVGSELCKRVFSNNQDLPPKSPAKLPPTKAVEQWGTEYELVTHRGGCHCGSVKYEALAPAILGAVECNCSLCHKKQMKYFTVPMKNFKLVRGHHSLNTYSFNTHKAKHNFCSVCGVESFFIPRDDPEGYAVVVSTVDVGTIRKVKIEKAYTNKK